MSASHEAQSEIGRADFVRFREFLTRHHPERLADLTPSTKPLLREVYKDEFLRWWTDYLLSMGAPIPLAHIPTDVRNHVIETIESLASDDEFVVDDG